MVKIINHVIKRCFNCQEAKKKYILLFWKIHDLTNEKKQDVFKDFPVILITKNRLVDYSHFSNRETLSTYKILTCYGTYPHVTYGAS